MSFQGFTTHDFDALTVPGLEPRMEAIIGRIRPKLETLGTELAPYLSALCGEEMHPHVAKHARRKVNPPNDTWVAWAASKRGYKALPHFQVGMFSTHLFIIFAVIYESPNKPVFARYLDKQAAQVKKTVPDGFYWSLDHMDPGGTPHQETGTKELKAWAEQLRTVKKAEIMCGLHLERDNPLVGDGAKLTRTIEETFQTLLPLYKGAY
ncbi:YktB family protein [Paenibacillus macerans]|uniref:YktB family protein n=1 Tax=Paenibacillus macerans TaxID=44252 RepID=UPI003D3118B2